MRKMLPTLALAGHIAGCATTKPPATQKPTAVSDDRWFEEGRPVPKSNPERMPVVNTPVCNPGDMCSTNVACCANQAPILPNDGLKQDMDEGKGGPKSDMDEGNTPPSTAAPSSTAAPLLRPEPVLTKLPSRTTSDHPETTVCFDGSDHPAPKNDGKNETHCWEEFELGWQVTSGGRGDITKKTLGNRRFDLTYLLGEVQRALRDSTKSLVTLAWVNVVVTEAQKQLAAVNDAIEAERVSQADLERKVSAILKANEERMHPKPPTKKK